MDLIECRERAGGERSARLATTRPDGRIDLVPIVFAFVDDTIVFAIDHKPKSTQRLQRLHNIAIEPKVTVLFDRYDDDWTQLWWVRMRGLASEASDPSIADRARDALVEKYEQYEHHRPDGPVVQIAATSWLGWSGAG